MGRTTVMWFRRDLRLHDHPALVAAIEGADAVAPLFVIDDALIGGRWPSPNRISFMLDSLRALDDDFRSRGSALHVRRGRPADVVPAFARECAAEHVYVSRDYSPYARARDTAVDAALAADGVKFSARRGTLVHEPEEVLTNEGRPFSVFSPYRRRWQSLPRRAVTSPPGPLSVFAERGSTATGRVPTLAELGVQGATARLPEGGERAARARLDAWVTGGRLDRYKELRDLPAADATSRLSADLRWGLLSPAEVVARAAGSGDGRQTFVSEIIWRDFYYAVLWHHPRVTLEAYHPKFRNIDWQGDDAMFDAWKRGRTGFPIVDAAMRQLLAEGWMHNRARMIVASFLTKDLLIDWRRGEAHFMEHLIDGDLASNNGGWQWAASTGTDAQPYFRIFNPTTQGKKFDPQGEYARRWLPELRAVPDAYIHEPWMMPADAQTVAGCIIGRDYPAPVVEHAEARERALAAYAHARADG